MTATADKMARNNILQNFNPSDFAYDGTPINLIQVQQISPDLAREEILNILGFKRATSGRKHRYLFLRGSKREKKTLLSLVKDKIQPYPKIDKKNGLTEEQIVESEQPTFTQIKLF